MAYFPAFTSQRKPGLEQMPKHVHFAPTNVVYSPIPYFAVSPTPSDTSLPSEESSSGPSTPPIEDLTTASAYPHTHFFPKLDILLPQEPAIIPIQIHFLLAFSPHGKPVVNYDLSLLPIHITEQNPPNLFAEAATNPPFSSLVLTSPSFKWVIVVKPASHFVNVVTVMDVFNALYAEFQTPVARADYDSLAERTPVDHAYYTRCVRIFDLEARLAEQQKGIKKIDLLKGQTQFLGLSGTMKGVNLWEVNLG